MPPKLRPFPIKSALIFNRLTHRRLPKLQGAMWAVRLQDGSHTLGVAIVGRPTARRLDNGSRLQVLRCSVIPGVENGCSMLYGACSRSARDMGASDLLTYIHDNETGISLKASGWILDEEYENPGGEWSVPSRLREKTVEPGPKLRYWAPWSDHAKYLEALKVARRLDAPKA